MITIEELRPEHFDLVAGWLSRPETNRWLTSDWRDREITPALIAITVRSKRNRLYLAMLDGDPAGLVGLADIDLSDRIAMVWYFLGRLDLARQGVVSRAVELLCERAFSDLGLAVLYAWAMEDNIPSRKVLQNNHFRMCGRIRNAAPSGTQRVDRIYFDLIPADFAVYDRTQGHMPR